MEVKVPLTLAVVAAAAFWGYRGVSLVNYGNTTEKQITGLLIQISSLQVMIGVVIILAIYK
jgi:hypothetical protein